MGSNKWLSIGRCYSDYGEYLDSLSMDGVGGVWAGVARFGVAWNGVEWLGEGK